MLALHSLVRWAAIAFGFAIIIRSFSGMSKGSFEDADGRFGRLFTISLDVQMLVGTLMYLFFSTITTSAFENMGSAMSNAVTRFWIVEHPTMVFAHIGVVRVRKAPEAKAKHRAGLIFFGIAMLLILVGTPWPFSLAARPILPFL